MAELKVPTLDFSSLSDLPQVYTKARNEAETRMTLADLGKAIQSGNVNYNDMAGRFFKAGRPDLGMNLFQLGQQQRNSTEFNEGLSRFYGGGSPSSPSRAASVAPQAPSSNKIYSNNEPSPLDPPSGADLDKLVRTVLAEAGNQGPTGMQAVANVVRNRAVNGNFGGDTPSGVVTAPNQFEPHNTAAGRARMAAIDPNSPQYQAAVAAVDRAYRGDDPTRGATHFYSPGAQAALGRQAPSWDNGTGRDIGDHRFFGGAGSPAVAAGSSPATDISAQARQIPGGASSSNRAQFLMTALSSPGLSAGQKELAKMLLAEEIKVNPEVQKLEAFRRDPGLMQMAIELKKAGATAVYTGDNTKKFDEELDQKVAARWGKIMDAADAAERKLVDINNMREISQRLGSQGVGANIKDTLGPYAEALGINVEGLPDIQAYNQIIQRLAPQQRATGSGSTSDIEFKGFLRSLPGLSQHPAAREMGLNTMEALARDEIARGEIASRLSMKEITRGQAEKELRNLPDPMKGFVEWRKANPQLYGQALKNVLTSPKQAQQQSGQPSGNSAPVQGARQAPDGNFYVPDPDRPGKYLQVR